MNFWPEIPNLNANMQSEPSLDTSTLWFSNNYHSFFTIYISSTLLNNTEDKNLTEIQRNDAYEHIDVNQQAEENMFGTPTKAQAGKINYNIVIYRKRNHRRKIRVKENITLSTGDMKARKLPWKVLTRKLIPEFAQSFTTAGVN